jgi:DNA-binding response OmpR family regulator
MKILLVEDEPNLGAAIERTLKHHKYIVDWIDNGSEAWSYLESNWTQYTLAIFDWLVPGMSGIELLKKLRAKNNPLPVLMLTAKDRMEDRVTGLDAGADDYSIKPFGMAELLARLRALQRRSPHIQPQQLELGNLSLDYGSQTVYHLTSQKDKETVLLTNKEFQLLEYFMKRPNQIVTSEQIRNYLWETDAESFSNVVAAQVRLLRRKLELISSANVIETLRGLGYRFNLESL